MTDYINRKELHKLLCGDKCGCNEEDCGMEERCHAGKIIEEISTADAVEVVRCKDCKHYTPEGEWCEIHSHFTDAGLLIRDWNGFNKDDFCSKGERKETANDR